MELYHHHHHPVYFSKTYSNFTLRLKRHFAVFFLVNAYTTYIPATRVNIILTSKPSTFTFTRTIFYPRV
jgi:hypothetical protein